MLRKFVGVGFHSSQGDGASRHEELHAAMLYYIQIVPVVLEFHQE